MKILIVEDHPLFVEGLRIILDDLLVGPEVLHANHAHPALELLEQNPDISMIMLDIGLPDIDGRALIKIIRSKGFGQPILVVSGSESVQLAQEMIRADAQGYVIKSSPLLQLRKAISDVLNGGRYVPEQWSEILKETVETPAGKLRITDRQLDVLYLLAQGHPNKVIAGWLGVSEHTIKTHIQALFDTLNVRNRTACVREAERLGLLAVS